MTKIVNALRAFRIFGHTLLTPQGRTHIVRSLRAFHNQPEAECSCCGYVGKFHSYGYQARLAVACHRCGATDRHRLFALAARAGFFALAGTRVLHFAPEPSIARIVKDAGTAEYLTADIKPGRASMVLDIERIGLPDARVDVVIASHVLEHVDDRQALKEIHRVLSPGGKLIALVPLIEGWDRTYEDKTKSSPEDRAAHFGQPDHVRFYGADFRDRLRAAGFEIAEFTAGGAESVRYRLNRGEKVFLAKKS